MKVGCDAIPDGRLWLGSASLGNKLPGMGHTLNDVNGHSGDYTAAAIAPLASRLFAWPIWLSASYSFIASNFRMDEANSLNTFDCDLVNRSGTQLVHTF